jgi:hypothetical protein
MMQLAARSCCSVARLLHCSSFSALRQQIQQQLAQALHSSSASSVGSSSSGDDHKFVGAYTPVTKQLWLDRLRKAQEQQQAAAGVPLGTDAQAAAKPPQVTRVEYPFTKDKFLLEMVSWLFECLPLSLAV